VQPSKRAITFTLLNIFQLYFLFWIFSNSSFICSFECFILAAWASRRDWNLFPLCRSTVFNVTYEEPINKRHAVGVAYWCLTASITEQTSLKIPYRFLVRTIL
jgi:hypothetical protein